MLYSPFSSLARLSRTAMKLNTYHYLPLGHLSSRSLEGVERRVRGVVFDMDGTLTKPVRGMFPRMRDALGIDEKTDILGHMMKLSGEERKRADKLISDIEYEAMIEMALQPGLDELLAFLELHKIPKAILTRNNPVTVSHLLSYHLNSYTFAPVLDRTYEPPKPSPEPLLYISKEWNVSIEDIIMVGDGHFDMLCARDAGSILAFVDNDGEGDPKGAQWRQKRESAQDESGSDIVVQNLGELLNVLRDGFFIHR
ncbi:uncharacterized protein VTP21DRAFT_9246 [Calcarisporiella thermophila]|uniref:uncharacterized protein n=1 Tax=Calcarisporiella thermophila TaxID=911321 RepID=UPI003743C003